MEREQDDDWSVGFISECGCDSSGEELDAVQFPHPSLFRFLTWGSSFMLSLDDSQLSQHQVKRIILSKSFPAEMHSRVNRGTRCSLTKSWTKISKTNYRGSCLPSRWLPGAYFCSPVTFLLLGDCFYRLLEIVTWNPVVVFFLNIDSNFEFYMSMGRLGRITSSIL